jgi:hypothetical protein
MRGKNFASAVAALVALWLLFGRFVSEFFAYQYQTSLLRVFAKCPGIPFGAYSGGPDYIDISIDIGLAVVAAVFIYLTIRDIRRKRRGGFAEDVQEEQDQERDEL